MLGTIIGAILVISVVSFVVITVTNVIKEIYHLFKF